MKYQGELSIVGACGGYSKTPAKHAPAVGNSVLNSPINNLGSGSPSWDGRWSVKFAKQDFPDLSPRSLRSGDRYVWDSDGHPSISFPEGSVQFGVAPPHSYLGRLD
jgi:hypothetical protein